MAFSASKPVSAKKLREHLQEEQEPFSLEIYLSERQYMIKCLRFNARTSCCLKSLLTSLKKPHNFRIDKKKIVGTTRYLKLILYKFISLGNAQESSNCSNSSGDELAYEKTEQRQQIPKTDSANSLTSSHPWLASSFGQETLLSRHQDGSLLTKAIQVFNLGNLKEEEIVKDRNLHWVCKRDKKLHNPVSVLQEVSSNQETRHEESPPISQTLLTKDANCNSMIMPSIWQSIMKSMIERQNQVVFAEVKETFELSGFIFQKTKWIMQRNKQLLFNRLKMVIRHHGRKKKTQKNIEDFMGPEYLESIIVSEQLTSWKKKSRNNPKVHQMGSEFHSISGDWNNSKLQRKKIGKQIADAITDEIVTELVDLLLK